MAYSPYITYHNPALLLDTIVSSTTISWIPKLAGGDDIHQTVTPTDKNWLEREVMRPS